MLQNEEFTEYEYILADNFIETLKTKYMQDSKQKNLGNVFALKKGNNNKNIVFVLGEEENEILKYGSTESIKNNYHLMLEVCRRVKNSVIVYKPFTIKDSEQEKDALHMLERIAKDKNNRIVIEKEASISHCIDAADEIHTINSIIGIEALVKNKKVVTYGFPFYGGWGLTEDIQFYERPRKKISLKKLILVSYMLYPRYITPNCSGFSNAENAITYQNNKNFINLNFDLDLKFNLKLKDIKTISNQVITFFKTHF